MRSNPWTLMILAALAAGCGQGENGGPQAPVGRMLIIAAEQLVDVAEVYARYRRSVSFEVEIASTNSIEGESLQDAVRRRVALFAEQAPVDQELFVLIVGDADESDPENTAYVPIADGYGVEYGDTYYADLDSDGLPDLSIGRIPYGDPADVEAYLERVEQYEATYTPGAFNKVLSSFAGEGGFGELIDGLLEMVAGWVFDEISYDFDMTMTYASPSSHYFLPDSEWNRDYAQRLQAGAVSVPYIGHTLGYAPGGEDDPPARRTLVAYLSCSDGEFQYPHGDSLAEDMLRRPQGPVAALAATTISHPYGNAILARELGHALLDLREPTYGQAVLTAKYNMVLRIDDLRQTIDSAAGLYTDEPLDEVILTHVVMYNLLGDPALPTLLPPGRILFETPVNALPRGVRVTVSGRVFTRQNREPMENGEIEVTLEVQRSRILGELIPREPQDQDPETCTHNHSIANDKVAARVSGLVVDGSFSVELDVPADLPDARYYLKGYARDDQVDSIGSLGVDLD